MQNLKTILILIPCLALLLAQCSVGNLLPIVAGKKIWLSNDEETLAQNVSKHLAVGSSVVDAKGLLEFNGFECRYGMYDELQPEAGWGIHDRIQYRREDVEYLICYLELPRPEDGMRYRLAIRYKDDTVLGIVHTDTTRLQSW